MNVEPKQDQDRRLVQRLKQRDPDAMMDLYEQYSRLLYSIILRAVHDSAVAEDLTQEAFLRIWNRIASFDEEKGKFEAWLVTVARNRAFDYLRSVRSAPEHSFVSLTDLEHSNLFSVGERAADRSAVIQAAKVALKALNQDQREVIELTHFEGMTQTEIAGKLKKPLGTVKGLVRSALKSLRSAVFAAEVQGPQVSKTQISPSQQVRHDL